MEPWQHCVLFGLAAGVGTFTAWLTYRHYPDAVDESTSIDVLVLTCFLAICGAFALGAGVTYLVGAGLALPRLRGLALHVCTALMLCSYAPWLPWLRSLETHHHRLRGRYLQSLTVRQATLLRRHFTFGMAAAVLIYLGHLTR